MIKINVDEGYAFDFLAILKVKAKRDKSSLEPHELTLMIDGIRKIEVALGDGKKNPSHSEIKNINIARKFIVASKFIKSGELFTSSNIIAKRSGKGISPINWTKVIGQKAKQDFKEDQIIEL